MTSAATTMPIDPAAHRAELGPLGAQQLREAVAAGQSRDRYGGGGAHRAASVGAAARNSTASRVSSM